MDDAGERGCLRSAAADARAAAIHRVAGYRGACLLRRDVEDGVEFATMTHFDGIDSVRAFAGGDLTLAVVPPEARALLSRWDERSVHYDVVQGPE